MGLVLPIERHAKQIDGALSAYDRVMVQGTLPVVCYADGMTAYANWMICRLLSDSPTDRGIVSLEPGRSRIRHRHRVSPASGLDHKLRQELDYVGTHGRGSVRGGVRFY
jgi:hypothetical protein